MKSLVILGDSLARPRPSEGVPPNDIYAHGIQRACSPGIFVVNLARHQNDTRWQTSRNALVSDIVNYPAKYYCIHLGIVDCAPRLVGELERIILGAGKRYRAGRWLATRYLALKSRYRLQLTKLFPRTKVPLDEFRQNIDRLIFEIRSHQCFEHLFIINIAYPGPYLIERSFGVLANIERYNAALETAAGTLGAQGHLIDIFSFTRTHADSILPDGHHINSLGHAFVTEQISGQLWSLEKG
jgi:hypothetical protein